MRVVAVAIASSAVAFVLCLPWSLTFLQRGSSWSVLFGAAGAPANNPSLSALLRFDLGPIGHGLLGYAFLAAALLVLLVGRGDRFGWATRFWFAALGIAALAWSASQGWLGAGGGDLAVIVAPVAVLIACLIGLGVASLMADLRSSSFGWRHLVTVGFGLCALAGLLPVLGASLGGRWGLTSAGYDSVLSWTAASGRLADSERLLWLGDPSTLPLRPWQVQPGLAIGISAGGLPDAMRLWPSPNPGEVSRALTEIRQAESGNTVRLGRALAASGIRYLIVPTATSPDVVSTSNAALRPVPQNVLDALAAQSDLHQLPSEGGALVFESTAWQPGVLVPPGVKASSSTPAVLRVLGVILEIVLWILLSGYYLRQRSRLRARRRARTRELPAVDEMPTPNGLDHAPVLVGAGGVEVPT